MGDFYRGRARTGANGLLLVDPLRYSSETLEEVVYRFLRRATTDPVPVTLHILNFFKNQGVDEKPLVKYFLVKSLQLKIVLQAIGASTDEQWQAFEAQFGGLALEEPESILEQVEVVLEKADHWLHGYFTAKAERTIY